MIREDVRDGRLIVTLDRANKANALTAAMLNELLRIVQAATSNRSVSTLILTGAGQTFSAGADLDEVRGTNLATDPVWEQLSGAVAAYPGLSIAALNGALAGGAMGMVLACDVRLAVPTAKFFYPVMKLGVLPQPSDPARLTRLTGPARAKRLLLGAEQWDANTALALGLIDGIETNPMDAAMQFSDAASVAERDHVIAIKAMLRDCQTQVPD